MQRVANEAAPAIEPLILAALPGAGSVQWLSPLREDAFAEYRDAAFLRRIDRADLVGTLRTFWPSSGPQWDGLAKTADGRTLLFEAKAHVGEVLSPPTKATPRSRAMIEAALDTTASFCRAKPLAPWTEAFYQLANRLAHLHFLRLNGVDACLGLVDFVGDEEMGGPSSDEAWDSAYTVVRHVMGLPVRHPLSAFVFHVRPDIRTLPNVRAGVTM